MKRVVLIGVVVTALTLGSVGSALAQGGSGRGGSRMYDPTTVETVTGTETKVERIPGTGQGGAGGVHLLLQTAPGEIPVHLGPAWYLENQPLKIEVQDTIQVRGSRVTFEGDPAIIAAEVKRGQETLRLRDEIGIPQWRGGPWRQ